MIQCTRCKKEEYEEDITEMSNLTITEFYEMKVYGIMLCADCASKFWKFMRCSNGI